MTCPCPEEAKIPPGLYPSYKKVKEKVLYYKPTPVKPEQSIPVPEDDDATLDDEDDEDEGFVKGDPEYVFDPTDADEEYTNNVFNCQRIVMAMMRHKLSPQVTADIVNSAGFDFGFITREDTSKGD